MELRIQRIYVSEYREDSHSHRGLQHDPLPKRLDAERHRRFAVEILISKG